MKRSLAVLLLLGAPLAAQSRDLPGASSSPFFGSVPAGSVEASVLSLSLEDAVSRGLEHNLGLLLSREAVSSAEGSRLQAQSDLLPHVSGQAFATREKLALAAFGFSSFPGFPAVIGPFDVYDARLFLSQQVLDLHALYNARAESKNAEAARLRVQDARDKVVLLCAELYLLALADSSRIEAAKAQLKTAQVLLDLATDRKASGVIPAVDVLRAQVQRDQSRQRLIVAENEFAKRKLALARAIGLHLSQEFSLSSGVLPHSKLDVPSLGDALSSALRDRADYRAAIAARASAEQARKAAIGNELPSLEVNADIGKIGNELSTTYSTYTLNATLKVPLFNGGKDRGKVAEAEARLRARQAELEDLKERIDLEIRSAVLDIRAAEDRVEVARGAQDLAEEQVREAKDRFAAGVANNVEVVQAQDALATASENYISSLYDHNIAKASLALALGGAESTYRALFRED